jgi:hypothetical protein
VAGVTAALNDGSITTTTLTDDSGSYLFPVLPVGGNYTAALSYSPGPGFPAYEFSPASFIVNNHQADQTALNSVASVMAGVPALGITGTHTGIFSQGQSGALYSLTVSNGSSGVTTSGTVTVTETAPAGLKVVSLSGAGWACGSSSCTRADSLDPGASYPPITAAVNVALNSAASLTNQASVSGGGSDPASVSDPTAVRTFSPCDVNQDSTTTVADVQKMIDEALGVAPGASDLNHDGVVNVVDVQLVINAALGLGCSG